MLHILTQSSGIVNYCKFKFCILKHSSVFWELLYFAFFTLLAIKISFSYLEVLHLEISVTILLLTIIESKIVHSCYLAKSELCPYAMQGTKDPLFLTGVTFPPDYPIYEETKIKLTVYDVKDKSQDTVGILLLLLLRSFNRFSLLFSFLYFLVFHVGFCWGYYRLAQKVKS